MDLTGNLLSSEYAPVLCLVLRAHPEIQNLFLAGNDFRCYGLRLIVDEVVKSKTVNVVDIVDNNLDELSEVARLIAEISSLKELYIGARRIQGSSGYPHGAHIFGAKPRFHGTPDISGYYATGFNEMVYDDERMILEACSRRSLPQMYIVSTERTELHVLQDKSCERPFADYSLAHYEKDEWYPEAKLRLALAEINRSTRASLQHSAWELQAGCM